MKPNKRKLLMYGVVAVVVAVGFWLGGYSYFRYSDEWPAAQQVISNSDFVTSSVGKVRKIELSPFGFYYRFSGDWAQARVCIVVTGDKAEARFKADVEMVNGRWSLKRIETK
jgi:hypothetical protein